MTHDERLASFAHAPGLRCNRCGVVAEFGSLCPSGLPSAMAYADELASERDALAASLESERREHASLAAAYRLASATKENLKKLREIAETERDALAGKIKAETERAEAAERELEAARADNRSLNTRLYEALKEAGEAQAEEALASQSLAHLRLAISEKDERLIDELMSKAGAGRAEHKMVRAELVEQARAEGYQRGKLEAHVGGAELVERLERLAERVEEREDADT